MFSQRWSSWSSARGRRRSSMPVSASRPPGGAEASAISSDLDARLVERLEHVRRARRRRARRGRRPRPAGRAPRARSARVQSSIAVSAPRGRRRVPEFSTSSCEPAGDPLAQVRSAACASSSPTSSSGAPISSAVEAALLVERRTRRRRRGRGGRPSPSRRQRWYCDCDQPPWSCWLCTSSSTRSVSSSASPSPTKRRAVRRLASSTHQRSASRVGAPAARRTGCGRARRAESTGRRSRTTSSRSAGPQAYTATARVPFCAMSPAWSIVAHALDVVLERLALVVVEPFGLLDRCAASVSTDVIADDRAAGVANCGRVEVQEHGQDAAALRAHIGEPTQLVAGDRVGCHGGRLPSLCRGRTPVGHGERFVVRWLLRTIVEGGLRVCIDGAPPSEVHR